VKAVKIAFAWLVKHELISKSPVSRVEAPAATPSEGCLDPDQWTAAAAAAKGTAIEDVLLVLRETGCRPPEIRSVEARFVQTSRWIFPLSLSKGKKVRRVVRMTEAAQQIVDRLMQTYSEGPIFRNSDGNPWTKNSLALAFQRLSKKVGFRITAYAIRHTFATTALTNGLDCVTVGLLMGHRDGSMVSKVYQHLAQREDHLRAALAKAVSQISEK